jgi:hypothetical protein
MAKESEYAKLLTDSDVMFNSLRRGSRYRIMAIEGVDGEKAIVKGTDIFTDNIVMRHEIDLEREFSEGPGVTISPESLLVSKAQSIAEIPQEKRTALVESNQEFRVIHHKPYPANRIILGMELKDLMDLCALLLESGSSGGKLIDMNHLMNFLKRAQKLLLTVRLNLENLVHRSEWLRGQGITLSQVEAVRAEASRILSSLPEVQKTWSKPWWNTDLA